MGHWRRVRPHRRRALAAFVAPLLKRVPAAKHAGRNCCNSKEFTTRPPPRKEPSCRLGGWEDKHLWCHAGGQGARAKGAAGWGLSLGWHRHGQSASGTRRIARQEAHWPPGLSERPSAPLGEFVGRSRYPSSEAPVAVSARWSSLLRSRDCPAHPPQKDGQAAGRVGGRVKAHRRCTCGRGALGPRGMGKRGCISR